MTIVDYFKGIMEWYDKNVPEEGRITLFPGASQAELDAFEREVKVALPSDFRELYSFGNGMQTGWLTHMSELLPLEGILDEIRFLSTFTGVPLEFRSKELEDIAKPEQWNGGWIPINDHEGDHLIMDLDPAKNGHRGQIFWYSHEEAGPSGSILGVNLTDFLRRIHDGLIEGEYRWSKQSLQVNRKEWDVVLPPYNQDDLERGQQAIQEAWPLIQQLLDTMKQVENDPGLLQQLMNSNSTLKFPQAGSGE